MSIPTIAVCILFISVCAYESLVVNRKKLTYNKPTSPLWFAVTLTLVSLIGIFVGHIIQLLIGKINFLFSTILMCIYAIWTILKNRENALKNVKAINSDKVLALSSILMIDEMFPISIGVGLFCDSIKFAFPLVCGISLIFIYKHISAGKAISNIKLYRIIASILLIVSSISEFITSVL